MLYYNLTWNSNIFSISHFSWNVCICAGMVPIQQQQQQQQQGFPMVPVMQPNMQGMMGMNFGGQMPPGAMPIQVRMFICFNKPLRSIHFIV